MAMARSGSEIKLDLSASTAGRTGGTGVRILNSAAKVIRGGNSDESPRDVGRYRLVIDIGSNPTSPLEAALDLGVAPKESLDDGVRLRATKPSILVLTSNTTGLPGAEALGTERHTKELLLAIVLVHLLKLHGLGTDPLTISRAATFLAEFLDPLHPAIDRVSGRSAPFMASMSSLL